MTQVMVRLNDDLFMDIDRSGSLPLYSQVSSRIEQAILSGDLPSGSRLENEVSLSERLGLSRPTIRHAIQELVDKGLLVRRRGIGTQVVHGHVTRNVALSSLYDDLATSDQHPTSRLLVHEVIAASAPIAAALNIATGEKVLHLRRLRSANGVPLAILENFLPGVATELDASRLEAHGLYQLMRSRGVTMRIARQSIGARRATGDESTLLEIEKGAPVLTATRTVYDHSGSAVEYGDHCYRPDLYTVDMTLLEK